MEEPPMSLTTLLKAHGDKGPHLFWREDLGQCHNPTVGCWCCICSGFMCGCPCHTGKYEKPGYDDDDPARYIQDQQWEKNWQRRFKP